MDTGIERPMSPDMGADIQNTNFPKLTLLMKATLTNKIKSALSLKKICVDLTKIRTIFRVFRCLGERINKKLTTLLRRQRCKRIETNVRKAQGSGGRGI